MTSPTRSCGKSDQNIDNNKLFKNKLNGIKDIIIFKYNLLISN